MAISDWPAGERPREKLLHQGAEYLSDAELLAIFLRTGKKGYSAIELARELLNEYGDLRGLMNTQHQVFCQHQGLGDAKYAQLQACLEISRRYFAAKLKRESVLTSVKDTRNYLISELRDEPYEVFALLLLDSKHRIIQFERLFYGTIDNACVYPRVILDKVMQTKAAAVILAHNHPSGVAEPSNADKSITERVIRTLSLVDVTVLDHCIVGDGEVTSFAEMGLI